MDDTRRRAVRLATRIGALAVTAAFLLTVAGLLVGGAHQSALAGAIRPASSGLPAAEVLGAPNWTLSTRPVHAWTAASIRLPEVSLTTGASGEDTGTATVLLDAAVLRVDGDRVTAESGTVSLELGAQEFGTPFGICGAYLSAFENGSQLGGAEPRARLAGRLLLPEYVGVPGAATRAGTCGEDTAAFDVRLESGAGTASAVIQGPDRSLAGRRLASGGGEPDADTDTGARLRFGPESMPLGLAPSRIEATAHSVTVTATFDTVTFSPADLAVPLRAETDRVPDHRPDHGQEHGPEHGPDAESR